MNKIKISKLISYAILMILSLNGCTDFFELEDTNQTSKQNQGSVTIESTATVQAQGNNFTIVWNKNTRQYGQLEITNNTTLINYIVSSSEQKKMNVVCIFDEDRNTKSGINDYTCSVDNSSIVGDFPLALPTNQNLLVLERKGKNVNSDFTVLSEFVLIHKDGTPKKPTTPPQVPSSLLTTTVEKEGANCEYGGTRVDTGKDTNGNNKLDNNEIEKTSYVCKSDDSTDLMATYPETAGANCPAGGARIDSGIDINENKQLDDNEIVNTVYICN